MLYQIRPEAYYIRGHSIVSRVHSNFMSRIPPNSLFSALAFVGFILAGLPLPWHMHSWHTGISMYMLWTSLGCLILFVNSILWNDNVMNWAPVWCDISKTTCSFSGRFWRPRA
ncbi:pheromone A receptor-domain-containing protein [Boletus edulis BED1]|uniref:Pheromone A receptor-domain-containing protein n=1 Tax=Boletus edulis BED1 TaxID=1328754 RepID=A0AAD4BQK2_BOLED|nr:pheromone A receptor-domain-containing protein [Boletus edulis BED1]